MDKSLAEVWRRVPPPQFVEASPMLALPLARQTLLCIANTYQQQEDKS